MTTRSPSRHGFGSWMVVAMLGALACGVSTPPEPEGTPVTLTADELDVTIAIPETREWYAWHSKGLSLAKSGEYDKALYCFNRAVEAWPRELEDDSQPRRVLHKPEPTDTYLQKAALYVKMGEPELAIVYYDKFEKYFPGNKIAAEGRAKAEAMLAE